MRCCVAALWVAVLALAAAEDPAEDTPKTDNEIELTEEEKRAWTNLHGGGGWGKRGWQDLNSAWGKRAWQDLNTAWGKRGWQDLNSAWGKRAWQDLNAAWGKRGWQDLNSAWGKRAWQDLNSAWGKRAWQDLNTAWGKRGWQDLNSAWGKRGWQDMSSAWGKRSPGKWSFQGPRGRRVDDYEDYEATIDQLLPIQVQPDINNVHTAEKKSWSELHGAWGKRPVKQTDNSGAYYWKREPGWTNLRGMWGKRAAQWDSEPSESEHESSAARDVA